MDPDSPNRAGPSRSSSPLPQPLTRRGKRRKLIINDSETEDEDYTLLPDNYDITPRRIRLKLTFNDEEFFKPISGYVTSEYDGSPEKVTRRGRKKVRLRKEREESVRDERTRLDDHAIPPKPPTTAALQVRGGGRRPPPRRNKPNNLPHHLNPRQTRSRNSLNSPQPTTETTLESISHESLLVKDEIHRLGLTLRDVTGDGNCLFRALADQLWGAQKRHAEVRRLVCDYLERERGEMGEFVEPFLVDGEGFEGYVNRMRQLKTFGSHIEIQAASRVLKRDVRVIMSTASFTIPWQTEGEKSKSANNVQTQSRVTSARPLKPTRQSTILPLTETTPHPGIDTPASVIPNEPNEPTSRTASRRHTRSQKPNHPHTPPDLESTLDFPSPYPLYLALFSLAEHFQSPRSFPSHEGPANIPLSHSIPHTGDQSESARRQRGQLPIHPSPPPTPTKSRSKPKSKLTPLVGAQPGLGEKSKSREQVDIDMLMNSLPSGHGIEQGYAEGILKRVKGNMVEAIEILLDEIHLYDDEDHAGEEEEAVGKNGEGGEGLESDDGKSGVGSEEQYSLVEELLLPDEGEGETSSTASIESGSGSGSRSSVIKVLTPSVGDEEVGVEIGEEMLYDDDDDDVNNEVGFGFRVREAPGLGKDGKLVLTTETGGLRVGLRDVSAGLIRGGGRGTKSRL